MPSHFIRQSQQAQLQSQGHHQVSTTAEAAGPGPSTSTSSLNATGSTAQAQAQGQAHGKGKEKGQKKRTRYASGLLAPPAVVPGGTPGVPRVQVYSQPGKRRNRSTANLGGGGGGGGAGSGTEAAGTRMGVGLGRDRDGPFASRTRLDTTLRTHNPSQISLGQLGQVLNSDPSSSYDTSGEPSQQTQQQQQQQQPQRRRRRVVTGDNNEENRGTRRRLTVSSREEGRALGVARGASMRRRNLWDGAFLFCSFFNDPKKGSGFEVRERKLTNDFSFFFYMFTTNRDTRSDRPGDGGTTTALPVPDLVQ